MQFLQIDLPKFRFTELGSKSVIRLNNNMHNAYKYQKEYVPVFHKLIWLIILYPFFCPLVYKRKIYVHYALAATNLEKAIHKAHSQGRAIIEMH